MLEKFRRAVRFQPALPDEGPTDTAVSPCLALFSEAYEGPQDETKWLWFFAARLRQAIADGDAGTAAETTMILSWIAGAGAVGEASRETKLKLAKTAADADRMEKRRAKLPDLVRWIPAGVVGLVAKQGYLAQELKVSPRTVQEDLKAIGLDLRNHL